MKRPLLIAEVKVRSPFGFQSEQTWDELFAVADRYGDMVAVHTDERWGGSFDLLGEARRRTEKPLVAKGIHASDDQVRRALDCGADYVLVVGRVPTFGLEHCLIEPRSLAGFSLLPSGVRAVWNARDLSTGERKTETFRDARALWPGWLCQASFVPTVDDVDPTADAVLVGQALQHFVASLQ